jgi:hypothetical protein
LFVLCISDSFFYSPRAITVVCVCSPHCAPRKPNPILFLCGGSLAIWHSFGGNFSLLRAGETDRHKKEGKEGGKKGEKKGDFHIFFVQLSLGGKSRDKKTMGTLFLGLSSKDLHANMRAKEVLMPAVPTKAKYLKHRRMVVDWMLDVGDEFDMDELTIHLGIAFLDRVLSRIPVVPDRYQLVAICCVLIAGMQNYSK